MFRKNYWQLTKKKWQQKYKSLGQQSLNNTKNPEENLPSGFFYVNSQNNIFFTKSQVFKRNIE